MKIDVIVVTHRKNSRLAKTVDVLSGSDASGIIVVVNGRADETVEYLDSVSAKIKNLKYVVIDKQVPKSRARNTGISLSAADILYFIDDDASIDPRNIRLLNGKFESRPEIDVIGGPNITPPESTVFQRLSGYLLASFFLSGKMYRRYTPAGDESPCDDSCLILCNLAFRKKCFDDGRIRFDERLHYNEENLLLRQLMKNGSKLLYMPELLVYHTRRSGILSFSRQVFGSGKGRAIMTALMPETLSFAHIIPSFFTVYLAASACLRPGPVYMLPLFAYTALAVYNSLRIAMANKERIDAIAFMTLITFVAHISYGAGFIFGSIMSPLLMRNTAQS